MPDEILTSAKKCLKRHLLPKMSQTTLTSIEEGLERSPLNVLCKVTVKLTIEKHLTLKKEYTDATPDELLKAIEKLSKISRLLKNIGLFCKRALQKRLYSAKETYKCVVRQRIHRCHARRIAQSNRKMCEKSACY